MENGKFKVGLLGKGIQDVFNKSLTVFHSDKHREIPLYTTGR